MLKVIVGSMYPMEKSNEVWPLLVPRSYLSCKFDPWRGDFIQEIYALAGNRRFDCGWISRAATSIGVNTNPFEYPLARRFAAVNCKNNYHVLLLRFSVEEGSEHANDKGPMIYLREKARERETRLWIINSSGLRCDRLFLRKSGSRSFGFAW